MLLPTGQPNPTDLLYDDSFSSQVHAGFGRVAFDATDSVEIALALRYDKEERKMDSNLPRVPPHPQFAGGQLRHPPALLVQMTLADLSLS